MRDCLMIIGMIFAITLVLTAPIVGMAAVGSSVSCHATGAKMELQSSWGFLTDCMVRVDNKWIPLSSYKVVKVRP